ncbi:hypothetical protein NPX13_g7551 [Xylaria arbuscula]|uniref:Uncharacterized protein n=1 Tax=Xylaria arbuscula TaxID=114810 RepID=A0A9W8N9S6_9PEZI|nr:hypothetical protein NPX13_g7551 [Xylaria arbuscula]
MYKHFRILKKFRTRRNRHCIGGFSQWVVKYNKLWANTWLWEISSITLSGVCLTLALSILLRYDQKLVPQFAYGITLNAIISTLTTFSKSFLLVAVAGAISQLKWRWFQSVEGRRVIDTQLFDDASRGPWGSLILLATPSRWSLASMGAVVTILALAFEPFTQQVTTYPVRQAVAPTTGAGPPTLYRAKTYIREQEAGGAIADLKRRFTAALWDTSNETESFATAQCSTGNCTWANFETLAFCTSCHNRTSDVNMADLTLSWDNSVALQVVDNLSVNAITKNINFHVPIPGNFLSFEVGDQDVTVEAHFGLNDFTGCIYPFSIYYPRHLIWLSHPEYGTVLDFGQEAFRNSYDTFLSSSFAVDSSDFARWQSFRIPTLQFWHVELETKDHESLMMISVRQASSCDMTLCVKEHSFSISNGVPKMDVLSERYGSWYFNITKGQSWDNYWWTDIPGRNGFALIENGTYPYVNLSSADFRLSVETRNLISFEHIDSLDTLAVIGGQLTGEEIFARDGENCISNETGIQIKNVTLAINESGEYLYSNMAVTRIVDNGGLPWAVPRLAAAASRLFRDTDASPVEGIAYHSIVIVEVRWPWLAFPVAIWLCGSLFLALTIWFCRGSDRILWKTSSLPLIYHGFEDRDVAAMKTTGGGLEHVSGMEKLSQKLYARIRRDSDDGQLKLTRTLPPT